MKPDPRRLPNAPLPSALPLASSNQPQTPRSAAHSSFQPAGTVGTTRGATPHGPRRVRPAGVELSERDRAVLRTVADLRLVTSRHLEALLYRDAATPLTAARKARRTLQRLVNLGLLRRLERLVGGLHAGSAAFTYAITGRGQQLLNLPGARRRATEPSLPFVAHTLAISDLYVELHDQVQRCPDRLELLDLQPEPACWRHWSSFGGSRELLRPDLYLAAGVGADEVRWFIEVDRGSEHRPALIRKCRAYQSYYDSGLEQGRDGVFPRVAWVVPDERRADMLRTAITSDHQLEPQLFVVLLELGAAEQLLT